MRASLLLVPLLLSCGGSSKPAADPTKPTGGVAGKESRGFDEYPTDYGADEYGEFGYDDGYYGHDYGEGYGGDYYGGYDEPYVPPPPTPPSLAGTWHGVCVAGDKDSHKLDFVITATRWDLSFAKYGDTTCTKRASLVEIGGPYSFGELSTTVTNAWNATFSFDKRDLTADDAKTAKALGKTCGVKKMKAGTAVSLLDKGCAKLGWKPLADCGGEFDLVSLNGTHLQFGARPADNDLCTDAKRPTALDASFYAYEWPATGIPECDAAFTAMDRYVNCPAMAPYMTGDMLHQLVDQMSYLKDATVCKQYSDAMAQGMSSMGC